MEFLSPSQARTKENPYWIFPLDVLEIKVEVSRFSSTEPSRGIMTNFMNIEIAIMDVQSGAYRIQKYDKRRELPFTYTQYIRFNSNRLIKQSYNIAVSQIVPILYISSSTEATAKEIEILIHTLTGNGFYEQRLRRIITQFLSSNPSPGLKFNITDLISSLSS